MGERAGKEKQGTSKGEEGRERRKNCNTEERETVIPKKENVERELGGCLANTAHLSYAFPGLNLLPHFFLSTTECNIVSKDLSESKLGPVISSLCAC